MARSGREPAPEVAWRFFAYMPGLIIYSLCAWLSGEDSFKTWWFFIGLGIFVSAVFVEHHFTSPQDAVVNAVASVGVFISANRTDVDVLWDLFLVLALITLVLALVATLPFEGAFKQLSFRWSSAFGRTVVLGGAALLIEVSRRVAIPDDRAWLFGAGVGALLVSVSGKWYEVFRRPRTSGGFVLDALGPSQLLLSGLPPGTTHGQVFKAMGHDQKTVDVVVTTTLPSEAGLRAVVVPTSGDWTTLRETFPSPIILSVSDEAPPFVGVVGPGSTTQTVIFDAARSVAIGETVQVTVAERQVLFQVVDAVLDSISWEGSRQVHARVSARQIGALEDGFLRIENELPEAHARITTDLGRLQSEVPAGFVRIGMALGTDIEIGVAIDPALRGHTAVLGMTGMGKTTVVSKICQSLATLQPVIAVDGTGEYRSAMNWPPADFADILSAGRRVFEPAGELTDAAAKFISWMLNAARSEYQAGQSHPRLLMFEEAHAMLPEQNISDWDQKKRVGESTRDIMQSRKYGLTYMFISQRTAVISKSALSQCESYVVLRTLDDTSLTYLEAIAGPTVRKIVPALPRFHALCFGPAFNSENPVIVALDPPGPTPPTSQSASPSPLQSPTQATSPEEEPPF